MKLHEVTDDSIFASMLKKLRDADEEVYFNAHNESFETGNDTVGWSTKRARITGWVLSHSVGRNGKARLMVLSALAKDQRGKGTHSSYHVFLEPPLDDNYTIKKVNGVWTILDKVQNEDIDDDIFKLNQLKKKLASMGISTEVLRKPGKARPEIAYLKLNVAGFEVQVFQDDGDWMTAWFKNGSRAGNLERFRTFQEIVDEIKSLFDRNNGADK